MDDRDTIISMFIDDELDLDGKSAFVERVHASREFRDETVALLDLEKELRADVVEEVPDLRYRGMPVHAHHVSAILRPLVAVTAAMAVAVVVLSFMLALRLTSSEVSHRFVIYEPGATSVDIAGSFTGWQRVPLEQKGMRGYWEATLDIPRGEHRFTYVLDDSTRFADPTITTRERDDFGGENSILLAGAST